MPLDGRLKRTSASPSPQLSSTDTTLIINGPDGRWYCDDDSWGDGDAEVRFNKPSSGTYDIWIGTFNGGTASAALLITETP